MEKGEVIDGRWGEGWGKGVVEVVELLVKGMGWGGFELKCG